MRSSDISVRYCVTSNKSTLVLWTKPFRLERSRDVERDPLPSTALQAWRRAGRKLFRCTNRSLRRKKQPALLIRSRFLLCAHYERGKKEHNGIMANHYFDIEPHVTLWNVTKLRALRFLILSSSHLRRTLNDESFEGRALAWWLTHKPNRKLAFKITKSKGVLIYVGRFIDGHS